MLQLSILTRFFETSTFGEYAVLNLSIEVFSAISLGGISTYLIHRKNISDKGRSTVFFIALATGVLTFLIAKMASPFILALFSYEYLTDYLEVLSVLLLIHAVSAQYESIAVVNFEHTALAKIEIAARCIAFGVAMLTIELQLLCLVIASITHSLSKMLLLMFSFSTSSKLKPEFDFIEAKRAWRYGIYNVGSQFLNLLRRQIDIIVLASTLNTSELGIYHVLRQLAARPGQSLQPIVRRITMPLMSEVQQGASQLQQLYYDTFLVFCFVMSFIYTPLIIFSNEITLLFFGEKYAPYHLILALLSVFWLIRIVGPTTMGTLVQTTGHTHLTFYWNLWTLPVSAIVMYISSLYGIYLLCASLIAFQLALFYLSNRTITNKIIEIQFSKLAWIFFITTFPFVLSSLFIRIPSFYFDISYISTIIILLIVGTSSAVSLLLTYKINDTVREAINRLKGA
ncbi:oligosaccharide flippase family protein [Alteromonas sp. H39]|uniref:oligosaccharide flippase family protein n=1 Tax=Alteromonas sp. H39 TaxID=3389876 RepID=UPI0039DFB704